MSLDQRAQSEVLIQLARQQQPGIGGHRGTPELDAKLEVERQANRPGLPEGTLVFSFARDAMAGNYTH